MNLIRKYQQFIKFGIVALGYNLFSYVMYAELISLKYNYLLASGLSFIAGVSLSYFMNKSIVFSTKHAQHNYDLVYRYLFFYLVLLGFNLGVLHIFVKIFTINPYFAQFLVIFISALLSYNIMRVFVFKRK